MALSRISITIPQPLVAAADRLAASLDRSRSWIVAEAVRRYAERAQEEEARTPEPPQREVSQEPQYRPGLDERRLAQLRADLGLTPEERVREAERTARLSGLSGEWGWQRLLVFGDYEKYLEWERREDLLRP
jgi:hypothetical protein